MQRFFSRAVLVLCGVACAAALGCGGGSGTRVSGKVTFKGAPVPAGKVYFIPDAAKGNKGATGYADIKDGSFDTSLPGGLGAPTGAVIVALEGVDPSAKDKKASPDVTAKLLFARYEFPFDVPKGGPITKDIDVPADAAKGPVAPKAPAGKIQQ